MTRTLDRSPLILTAAALLAAVLLVAACGGGDPDEVEPTNDVAAGICAEGSEDCDDTVDVTPEPDATEAPEPAPSPEACSDARSCEENSIEIARRDLASQLGLEVDAIEVVSSEAQQWPDACLGAAKPGTVCAQVITPGFKIVLEGGGKQYEYHTDEGTRAVLVE